MKDYEQLADTETGNVSGVIKEVWSKDVQEAARAKRVFRNLITFNDELLNKPGSVVHIPYRSTLTAAEISESGTISPQIISYGTALSIIPVEIAVGVKVSKAAIRKSGVNIIRGINKELGESQAQLEDTDLATVLAGGTSNILWGNDATGTADIAVGDVLTPELFAKAKLQIEKNNWVPTDCVIGPQQSWQLSTYPQFTNASYFGSRDVIVKGLIPSYLGIKIHVSTNVPSGTAGIGTDVPYHTCLMFAKNAAAIAVSKNIEVETSYDNFERKNKISATMYRDQDILEDSAVCSITCSDS